MGKHWWGAEAVAVILFLSCGLLLGKEPEPNGPEHFEKGINYYEEGVFEGAAEEFVKAFSSDKSHTYYQAWLGKVLVDDLKKYDSAIELLEKAPNKEQSADALYWLGKAYFGRADPQKGDLTKAYGYAKRAYDIEREPEAKAAAEKLLREIIKRKQRDDEENDTWKDLGVLLVLFVIIGISVSALVVLKRFVFPQPSALRDILLFLVMVLVMVFSAAQVGIITGQQFTDIYTKIVEFLISLRGGKG